MGFKRLEADDFVVSAQAQTSTAWTGNLPNLTTFFTQSSQVVGASGEYYATVYNADPSTNTLAEAQFEIAYGNENGGGTFDYNNAAVPGVSPSLTIYGQYRTLVLEDETAQFSFGGVKQGSIYALSIERSRYKQSLFPGSLNLKLTDPSTGGTNAIELTDNSNMVSVPEYYGTMRAYQIISGSNGVAATGTGANNSNGYTDTAGSYGLFLPDIGTILLNGAALDLTTTQGISLDTTTTANTPGANQLKLYEAIKKGQSFGLNSEETITSDFVFVRTRNSEFNYSENPSYISGSTGEVIYNYFINNPQTYITTVGMYNDSNELLAVAKL